MTEIMMADAQRFHDKYIMRLMSYKEIMAEADAMEAWLSKNVYVTSDRCIAFLFYPGYEIDLDECPTHSHIVGWVHHLAGKGFWRNVEDLELRQAAMSRTIELMCSENGLPLYPKSDTPKKAAKKERNALTAAIRWQVLHRDGYKCKACNAVGVPLHVDHIVPVSRGGRTVMHNLQTLCETCNLGKGATAPTPASTEGGAQ